MSKTSIIEFFGFNSDKAMIQATQFSTDFPENIKDIKTYGCYTYSELSCILGIKVNTLKKYVKFSKKQTLNVRVPVNKIVYASLFADYLRNHIPPRYYKLARKRERQRQYREELKARTRVVKCGRPQKEVESC